MENTNKGGKIQTTDDLLDLLAFSHHRFVEIHPFNNGNGRTARLFTDFLLLLNAYMPLDLYHRDGDARQVYIQALRAADIGNLEELKALMQKGLTPF